jgi:hypothetical protein
MATTTVVVVVANVATTSDGALGDDCVDQIDGEEDGAQHIDDEELQSGGGGVE